MVILPDFQGIGLATILMNFAGKYYKDLGYVLYGTTSNPAIIHIRGKVNSPWRLVRTGRVSGKASGNMKSIGNARALSRVRLTTSWKYVGISRKKSLNLR